jgi:hypothetical protein
MIIKKVFDPKFEQSKDIEDREKLGPYTPEFKKDSVVVANYLKRIFEKKHFLTSALIHNPSKKGRERETHVILREHLLGPDHIVHMVVALKADLDTKKTLTCVAKHTRFQSRANHLENTTKL